ncbi:Putative ABC-type phosphate-transport system, binding lipoprotein precursor component [Flavobacterium indicum GPTSA100-9 = DSM 17447]|uniref:Putative ABC-type phosphate-transport system, binding lipoprotein component n=1 Tax=Flavobacterium indicum (strain DSM 17447 / CIP 109464 / GPTSA100-9) TaxID=1094466 RepID=H8XSL2_FLAIG|nr:substrate-binding domain-containing protein [Flavobacterium indicum]CCG52597.1 Putative ABC-type phosphate-transport system, binding lipoprotein precursor component [Flavobacterium indicum GPTSA100-9 = DSM 17447]
MKRLLVIVITVLFVFVSCNKSSKEVDETITTGKLDVWVDETLMPIMQEQKAVFESQYSYAKVNLIGKSENEISKAIIEGKANYFVLSRKLNDNEIKFFKSKTILGKVTPIATDGIAVIVNKENNKTSTSLNELSSVLNGSSSNNQLVFDNANSSTLRFLMEKTNVKSLPKTNVAALNNNLEVIKFVSQNANAIGFVGVNWITDVDVETENLLKNVKVLSLEIAKNKLVKPSQSSLALNEYPLSRKIYLLNYQGKTGLGMGFASFVAGNVGQRIILKSGLLPEIIPTRELKIRKKI